MGREKELIDQLTQDIEGLEAKVCYGGSMSVPKNHLRLFFEDKTSDKVSVIQLPAEEDELKTLVDACTPATFGRGNEDVFDVEYRDAVYLDVQHFAIHFHLAITDLLNEISKWMIPHNHDLRAELYKLNVYTVGGHFKTHVDTPRRNDMVGSLVVCLPSTFEGGQLIVKHKEKKWEFEWGTASNQEGKVQWAAFYSDCEHEILPVTKGHRLTLTYNLYSKKIESAEKVTIDLTTLPFYNSFNKALNDPEFLPRGGVLGFCLHHAYPLTKDQFNHTFGDALKGSDILLYEVTQRLGVKIEIKAVYEVYAEDLSDEDESEGEGGGEGENEGEGESEGENEGENESERREVVYDYLHPKKVLMVGDHFIGGGNDYEERSQYHIAKQDCNARLRSEIIWCNDPTEWEKASTYVAYGNEAESVSMYVAGAFLIDITPWSVREKMHRETNVI